MVIYLQIKQIIQKIKSSDIATRLTAGAFWSLLGNVAGKGFILFAFILVAKIIGKESYGELGMIRSTIMMFSVFAGVGIGLTASRYIALCRNTDIQKAHEIYCLSKYVSIIMGLLFSILLCVFAPLIAEQSLHAQHLTGEIRIGAIVLFFITLNSAQTGALLGFERFKSSAINIIISGFIQLLFLTIGAYYWGVSGVIGGMGIGSFILYFLNQYTIRSNISRVIIRQIKIKQLCKNTFPVLWKFSFPAILSSILVIPVLWWCKTLMVQTAGFDHMADYDVAEQWNTIILFIPSTLGSILVPILSNTLAEGTKNQYRKIVKINIVINVFITSVIVLFICLFASFILRRYGVEFTDKKTFYILILSAIPNAVCAVLGHVIASKGKMWIGFILNFIWAIWCVGFSILFINKMNYGAVGLAMAVFIAYILYMLLSWLVWKYWSETNSKSQL
ncbi:MAG: oligosaccharide flippase family protein [Bacteroidales bacterium]|nr:oligosaccharide flippase family protein [Bacteroidales bacterium]